MINIGVVSACIEGFSRAGVSRWGHTLPKNIGGGALPLPFSSTTNHKNQYYNEL